MSNRPLPRRPRGRPRKAPDDRMRTVEVTLLPWQIDQLRIIGAGNVSLGIRTLLERSS
jgi:hypothetical protein